MIDTSRFGAVHFLLGVDLERPLRRAVVWLQAAGREGFEFGAWRIHETAADPPISRSGHVCDSLIHLRLDLSSSKLESILPTAGDLADRTVVSVSCSPPEWSLTCELCLPSLVLL